MKSEQIGFEPIPPAVTRVCCRLHHCPKYLSVLHSLPQIIPDFTSVNNVSLIFSSLLFKWRRAQDSNLQTVSSQTLSRRLPHHPDTRHSCLHKADIHEIWVTATFSKPVVCNQRVTAYHLCLCHSLSVFRHYLRSVGATYKWGFRSESNR